MGSSEGLDFLTNGHDFFVLLGGWIKVRELFTDIRLDSLGNSNGTEQETCHGHHIAFVEATSCKSTSSKSNTAGVHSRLVTNDRILIRSDMHQVKDFVDL